MAKVVSVEKEPVVSPIKSITVELTKDEADLLVSFLGRTPYNPDEGNLYTVLSETLGTIEGSYEFTDGYGDRIKSMRPRKR